MSLSPGERESLGEIETRLNRSDPRLAAMLTDGTITRTRRCSARMSLRRHWPDRGEFLRFLVIAVGLAVTVVLAVVGVLTTHSAGPSGPGRPASVVGSANAPLSPDQRPVIDQLMVSGATSGVPTSTWRFSREPSGTSRGLPLNTCPFTITVTLPCAGPT